MNYTYIIIDMIIFIWINVISFQLQIKEGLFRLTEWVATKKIRQEGQEQGENTYTWPILPQPESYDRDIALLMSQHV